MIEVRGLTKHPGETDVGPGVVIGPVVRVVSPHVNVFAAILEGAGAGIHREGNGVMIVHGLAAPALAALAARHRVRLDEVTPQPDARALDGSLA